MNSDLKKAALDMRLMALQFDNAGHLLREQAFYRWRLETVLPAAVCRWVREIGETA